MTDCMLSLSPSPVNLLSVSILLFLSLILFPLSLWWGMEKTFEWFWLLHQVVHFSDSSLLRAWSWCLGVVECSAVSFRLWFVLTERVGDLWDMWAVLGESGESQTSYSDYNLFAVWFGLQLLLLLFNSIVLYAPVVCSCLKPGVVICVKFVSEKKEDIANCCC